jgi:hypothetical protein
LVHAHLVHTGHIDTTPTHQSRRINPSTKATYRKLLLRLLLLLATTHSHPIHELSGIDDDATLITHLAIAVSSKDSRVYSLLGLLLLLLGTLVGVVLLLLRIVHKSREGGTRLKRRDEHGT